MPKIYWELLLVLHIIVSVLFCMIIRKIKYSRGRIRGEICGYIIGIVAVVIWQKYFSAYYQLSLPQGWRFWVMVVVGVGLKVVEWRKGMERDGG